MDSSAQGQQGDALAEGRRIYLGNLLYSVRPDEIEDLLRQTGCGNFEKLHVSIDPVSGRNPGYCFVEFPTRHEADAALESLPGTALCGRPVKTGPCHPKTAPQSRWSGSRGSEYTPTFQRWGDWEGAARAAEHARDRQGPHAASRHVDEASARFRNATRLFVGGLGKMISQEHHDTELRELLAGLDFVAIGKRITPPEKVRALPGNHHYCFVDFSTSEEADRAIEALHGREVPGGLLRVSYAKTPVPPDAMHRGGGRWRDAGASAAGDGPARPAGDQPERRQRATDRQRAILAADNWRSGPKVEVP